MDQVQVQVLETQVRQGAGERLGDVLLVVVGVPELEITNTPSWGWVRKHETVISDSTIFCFKNKENGRFTLEVMKSSSRVTSPLSMARLIPWPTWTSLP